MFLARFKRGKVPIDVTFPWKIGIVSFMAFPEMLSKGNYREVTEIIVSDPFFDLIELPPIPEKAWLDIEPILSSSRKEVFIGLQPVIMTEGKNLCSLIEGERLNAVEFMKDIIHTAADKGIKKLALCSGPDPGPEKRIEATNALIKSLTEIAADAAEEEVYIQFETFDRDHDKKQLIGPIQEAANVVKRVRSAYQNIGILWDLSHAPLLNEKPAVLGEYSELISHIHIGCAKSINDSLRDWHPGFYRKGSLNSLEDVMELIRQLDLMEYDGAVSFEVKPEQGQSSEEVLNAAKGVLFSAFARFIAEQFGTKST